MGYQDLIVDIWVWVCREHLPGSMEESIHAYT